MITPPPLTQTPTEQSRIELGLVPAGSSYVRLVRQAVRAAGADFVRTNLEKPTDTKGRLFVVDLTDARTVGHLGPRVIAISNRLELDCFDVITPEQVRSRLKRSIRNLVEREVLLNRIEQERNNIEILNEIGHALSAHTDRASLLDSVLTHARNVLRSDGGSIYLVDKNKIRFICSQNDTIPFRASRMELPLDDSSLAGYVAVQGKSLNISDAYHIPKDAAFRPNFTFDEETGYRTRSMLLVPMNDREGEVIGVLALVNRKSQAGVALTDFDRIEPFTDQHSELARSIASQAAVAIENYRLYKDIRELFSGFVTAAVTAIEARDPSTGGHSHRVASLTTELAKAVDATSDGPFNDVKFNARDQRELHYASMLHDFGKVGVREQVLLKAEKLYDWEMNRIEARFRLATMQVMLETIREQAAMVHADDQLKKLKRDLGIIRRLNRPTIRPEPVEIAELERIRQEWHLPDRDEPLLDPRELKRLCIPIGSLDPEERREIEMHVTHTYNFLKVIPWTRDLQRVPDLAFAHHEKLNGSGYPRGLTQTEIPLGSQLMAIGDIFDALTANDRPYKAALSVKRALDILRFESEEGKLNTDAVELFSRQEVWKCVIPN